MTFEDLFTQLCTRLAKEEIPYLVLRNYATLPYSFINDVDILVNKNNIHQIENILLSVLEGKAVLINERKRFNLSSYKINDLNGNLIVKLDFFSGLSKGWISYMDTSYMLENKMKEKCFYIPILEFELYALIMKEMYMYGKVRSKYADYLQAKNKLLNLEVFYNLLRKYLSKKSAQFVYLNINDLCHVNHFPKPRLKLLLNIVDVINWGKMAIIDNRNP